jgi:hypothetical protein
MGAGCGGLGSNDLLRAAGRIRRAVDWGVSKRETVGGGASGSVEQSRGQRPDFAALTKRLSMALNLKATRCLPVQRPDDPVCV